MMAKCIVLTAVVMLAVACLASPLSKDTPANTNVIEGLSERPPEIPEILQALVRRSVQLSEDQRELMSRQLLQALSEIIQREDCFTDYQGWVDFGRRSAD